MPRTTEVCTNGGSVKVGTTGTIGALMKRELESIKNPSRTCTSARRKLQTSPLSVLCSDTPTRLLHSKNQPKDRSSGSSSSNGHSNQSNPPVASQKPRYSSRKNSAQRVPMLGSEGSHVDGHLDTDKIEMKGYTYVAKVVDLKCGNPMSSRLRKLGFAKLSGTIS